MQPASTTPATVPFSTTAPQLADGPLPSVVVVLVMGLPAAGKSTFIHQLATQPSPVLHHICIDELYEQQLQQPSLTASRLPALSFSPAVWHAARDAAYQHTVQLLHKLSASVPSLLSGCNVVCVDDVFHLRSMRHAYYRLCRSLQIPFHQLLINTPLAACLANLAARSSSATTSAAHWHLTAEYVTALHGRFDWPSEAELRYTTIREKTSSGGVVDCSFLHRVSVPQPTTADEATAAHMQSVVHALDIALRRAVGQQISEWSIQQRQTRSGANEYSNAAVASYARDANELRKCVLTEARQSGTAVYEMMQAVDEGDLGQVDEQHRVTAAVQRAVSYFNSLIDSTTPTAPPLT